MSLDFKQNSFNKPLINNHIKPSIFTLNKTNTAPGVIVKMNKTFLQVEDYVSSKFIKITAILWENYTLPTKFPDHIMKTNIGNLFFDGFNRIPVFKSNKTDQTSQFFILGTNAYDCKQFICNNLKSQHLCNQIHLFRTERQSDIKLVTGFGSKVKGFFFGVSEETPSPKIIIAIAIIAITLYAGYYALRRLSIYNSSITSMEVSIKSFSDVKGANEAKKELQIVVEFLKNPDKFLALGGKLPKGVLLFGPPGTGKTLLAKAVAGEAGVPFYSTSGPELNEVYVGARRIRELFKLAKEAVPCVIFIDEIDAIGKKRKSSSLHPYANDTLNHFLSEMDGLRNTKGVIVLGATNRKNDLDKALVRPGRFDVEVNVAVPDYRDRKELFEFYLEKIRYNQDVDVDRLAYGTPNFTGVDIENLVNQAALQAAVMGATNVSMSHLEQAFNKVLKGPESLSRIVDEETNRITAYHEAGHTVVAYFTKHSQPLFKVSIKPWGSSLGHTSYILDKDMGRMTKIQLLAMLDTMMGGRAAEELVFGEEHITFGASDDLREATQLATEMVSCGGMSAAFLMNYSDINVIGRVAADQIVREVNKLLRKSLERAKHVLKSHRQQHEALSKALLEHETLDAVQIKSILDSFIVGKLFHP